MKTKKKPASPVSRSVYQKEKEKNKRLMADLKLICFQSLTFEAVQCKKKWKDHFQKEEDFKNLIRSTLRIPKK